jgi:hypothetical protein
MDGCFSCGRAAMFSPVDDVSVCLGCAKRIAVFVIRASSDRVDGIWFLTGSPPGAHQRPVPTVSLDPKEIERILAEFERGLEKQLGAEDTLAHLDLAGAYREMGLLGDALREAAVALHSTVAHDRREADDSGIARAALKVLLTAPLLKQEGLRVLREALRAQVELN